MKQEAASAWRLVGSAAGIFLFAVVFALVAIVWALLPRDAPIEPYSVGVMGVSVVALLVAVGYILRSRLNR